MKRIAVLFFMILSVNLVAQSEEKTFIDYLVSGKTTVRNVSTIIDSSKRPLTLVLAEAAGKINVYKSAVIYSENKSNKSIYLLVLGPYIFGANGNILIDVSKAPGVFYGWQITILKNVKTGKDVGINLDCFGDGGTRAADSIELIWDIKNNQFCEYKIDPSEY